MPREIEDLLSRHKRLKDQRRVWESHWQELAEVMLPRRADFTTERIAGERWPGHVGFAGDSAYAASKAAVDGLTRTFAKELAPRNIRVNSVNPGLVETAGTHATEGSTCSPAGLPKRGTALSTISWLLAHRSPHLWRRGSTRGPGPSASRRRG